MHDFVNTATTSAYDLAGIAQHKAILDETIAHKRFIQSKQNGELCDLERCAVCCRIYEEWIDEMEHERRMSYAD